MEGRQLSVSIRHEVFQGFNPAPSEIDVTNPFYSLKDQDWAIMNTLCGWQWRCQEILEKAGHSLMPGKGRLKIMTELLQAPSQQSEISLFYQF